MGTSQLRWVNRGDWSRFAIAQEEVFRVCWSHQKAGTALLLHDGLDVGCTGAN